MPLTGNRGEWSEIYIFLKLINDGKIYAADKNMKRLANVYLGILKIIREENPGLVYEYQTGNPVKIYLNHSDVGPDTDVAEFNRMKNKLWDLLGQYPHGSISSSEIEDFLRRIHIEKLKTPASSNAIFFGGTEDIVMEISDYRTSITSIVGFSCKSDFSGKSTLFNASQNNTNFRFEIVNGCNDAIMNDINSTFDAQGHIAVADRIKKMKTYGLDVIFDEQLKNSAKRNLVMSGGMEMPLIVAGMLKNYYWEGNGESAHSSIAEAIDYVANCNPASYAFDDLADMYKTKIAKLLYDMFTGMKLKRSWDGRASVTGGYIIVKEDGDVLAYHTTLIDEFKDFLIERLGLETPSNTKHNAMQIYKQEMKYFINFNLQVRFKK